MRSFDSRGAGACLVVGLALLASSSAYAVGLGANFTYGYNSGNASDTSVVFATGGGGATVSVGTPRTNFQNDHYGFGFTVDTAVASDKLFNYRLDLNYESVKYNQSSGINAVYNPFTNTTRMTVLPPNKTSGSGLSMNHAFGFGIMRNEALRLWMGPSIRVGVASFDISAFSAAGPFAGQDWVQVEAGGGGEIGLNVHTGDLLSIGLTGGYQYLWNAVVADTCAAVFCGPNSSLDGGEHRLKAGVTILFKLPGDKYKP